MSLPEVEPSAGPAIGNVQYFFFKFFSKTRIKMKALKWIRCCWVVYCGSAIAFQRPRVICDFILFENEAALLFLCRILFGILWRRDIGRKMPDSSKTWGAFIFYLQRRQLVGRRSLVMLDRCFHARFPSTPARFLRYPFGCACKNCNEFRCRWPLAFAGAARRNKRKKGKFPFFLLMVHHVLCAGYIAPRAVFGVAVFIWCAIGSAAESASARPGGTQRRPAAAAQFQLLN